MYEIPWCGIQCFRIIEFSAHNSYFILLIYKFYPSDSAVGKLRLSEKGFMKRKGLPLSCPMSTLHLH